MPEYLYPGVYVEEIDTGLKPIPGVSTTTDKALESLAADFRRILHARVPEWTDFDESDPGATLLEIFAFLAESLLYRANEIPRGRSAALRAAAALAALGGVPGPGCEGVKRPLFFTGQLLDAATLAAEQEYHREKRRLHNRALLGYGVVSGLGVRVDSGSNPDAARIVVEPGYAIDCRGEEIALSRGATLQAPKQGDSAFVTLRFWEHVCPSPPPAERIPSGMPAVEEVAVIGVGPSAAAPALALARLVRSQGLWQVDPAFAPPRVLHREA